MLILEPTITKNILSRGGAYPRKSLALRRYFAKTWRGQYCLAEGKSCRQPLYHRRDDAQTPDRTPHAGQTHWPSWTIQILATRYLSVDGRSKPFWRRLKCASVRALITGARCVPMAITDAAQGIHQRMSPTSNLPFGAPRTSLPNFSAPAGPGNRPLSDRIGEIDMELDDVVRHLKLRHESQEKLESCTP